MEGAGSTKKTVFTWGEGEDGQLGYEVPNEAKHMTYISVPTVIQAFKNVFLKDREFGKSPVVAGSRNSIAISDKGEIFTWGWNARGTLGLGHKGKESIPKPIKALQGIKMVQCAVGGWHCLGLSEGGQTYAWGGNEYEQCGLKSEEREITSPIKVMENVTVRQVAAGAMHSLALDNQGQMWAWGMPLCDYENYSNRSPWTMYRDAVDSPREGIHIVKVAAGAFHNLALRSDGVLLSWGRNDYGSLGTGDTTYHRHPVAVLGLEGVQVVDIACGGWHSVVIAKEKGFETRQVYAWGRGEHSRLGLGEDTDSKPIPFKLNVPDNEDIAQASCGGTHTMLLTTTGRVFIFGRGAHGRLAQGPDHREDSEAPIYVEFPGGPWRAVSVSAGGRHSIAVLERPSDFGVPRKHSGENGATGERLSI